MNLRTACPSCHLRHNQYFTTNIPYQGKKSYIITCPNGHSYRFTIFNHHFDLMFYSACNAMLDHYFGEAIVAATGALETFRKFYLEIIFMSKKLNIEIRESLFKEIRLSERLYGAFQIIYYLNEKELPLKNSTKIPGSSMELINMRNKVSHEGYYPTPEETHEFCRIVYEEINKVLDILVTKYNDSLDEKHQLDIEIDTSGIEDSDGHFPSKSVTLQTPFFISYYSMQSLSSFDEEIEKLRIERMRSDL